MTSTYRRLGSLVLGEQEGLAHICGYPKDTANPEERVRPEMILQVVNKKEAHFFDPAAKGYAHTVTLF